VEAYIDALKEKHRLLTYPSLTLEAFVIRVVAQHYRLLPISFPQVIAMLVRPSKSYIIWTVDNAAIGL